MEKYAWVVHLNLMIFVYLASRQFSLTFGHIFLRSLLYVQIIGQVVNRTQPVRYTGVYQNFQTAPPYIHSNPQNVQMMINLCSFSERLLY